MALMLSLFAIKNIAVDAYPISARAYFFID
jgi:hypothetical protein